MAGQKLNPEEQREMLADLGINPAYQKAKLSELSEDLAAYANHIKVGAFNDFIQNRGWNGILFYGPKAKDHGMALAGALALNRVMNMRAIHLSTVSDNLDRQRYREEHDDNFLYGTALLVHPFVDHPVGRVTTAQVNMLDARAVYRVGAWLEHRGALGEFTILVAAIPEWSMQTWWPQSVVSLIEKTYGIEETK